MNLVMTNPYRDIVNSGWFDVGSGFNQGLAICKKKMTEAVPVVCEPVITCEPVVTCPTVVICEPVVCQVSCEPCVCEVVCEPVLCNTVPFVPVTFQPTVTQEPTVLCEPVPCVPVPCTQEPDTFEPTNTPTVSKEPTVVNKSVITNLAVDNVECTCSNEWLWALLFLPGYCLGCYTHYFFYRQRSKSLSKEGEKRTNIQLGEVVRPQIIHQLPFPPNQQMHQNLNNLPYQQQSHQLHQQPVLMSYQASNLNPNQLMYADEGSNYNRGRNVHPVYHGQYRNPPSQVHNARPINPEYQEGVPYLANQPKYVPVELEPGSTYSDEGAAAPCNSPKPNQS